MSNSREIYNQGRVVGYSAYELYVKHYLSDQSDTGIPPATEREWLASTLSSGASLLVRIPTQGNNDDDIFTYDVQLPNNSRLCAANTIVASFFNGEGYVPSGSTFATRVKSYGPLIRNDSQSSPTSSRVPTYSMSDLSQTTLLQIRDYIKLIDGLVLQPGQWEDSGSSDPKKLLDPDLTTVPTLRFMIKGKIENPFFILLTGFTMRTVVQGESKIDPTFNSSSPSDGDFLGPGSYPWANKIIFSVPNAFIKYFVDANYKRKLPKSGTSKVVDDTPIIDMRSSDPIDYYTDYYTDSPLDMTVDRITCPGEGGSVLAIYQRSDVLPPALYGARVTSTGDKKLVPIDTTAPGTVKLFNKDTELQRAKDLENNTPHNYALLRDSTTMQLYELTADDKVLPVAETSFTETNIGKDSSGNANTKLPGAVIKTGNKVVRALSLNNSDGTAYPISASPSSEISSDNIKWLDLISAFTRDKSINILGKLSGLKSKLAAITGTGKYVIGIKNGVVSSLDSLSSLIKAGSGITLKTDSNGAVTITNSKPDVELNAGTGISIKKDGDKVIITNSMPNYASGGGFTLIHPGLDYDLKFFNGFTNSYSEAVKNESNYKIFRYPGLRTKTKANRSGVMNIHVSESRKDVDDSLVSLALSIGNSVNAHQYAFATQPIENYNKNNISSYDVDDTRRYNTKLQHPNLRNVYMLHADDITKKYRVGDSYMDGFQSVLFRLRFIRDDYLSFAKSKNWDNEPTSGGTGIWNLKSYDDGSSTNKTAKMYPLSTGEYSYRVNDNLEAGSTFGASWQGRCTLMKLTTNYFDNESTGAKGYISQGNDEWQTIQQNNGVASSKRTNTAAYDAMKDGLIQQGDLLLVFVQYADGYNSQFYNRPYRNEDIGSHFYSYDMNLSIYGAFS